MIAQICFVANKKKKRKKSVSLPFILHHYLNEADAYTRIFVAEKPPMDKETVSGLRKNNRDIYLIVVAHFPDVTAFRLFLVSW